MKERKAKRMKRSTILKLTERKTFYEFPFIRERFHEFVQLSQVLATCSAGEGIEDQWMEWEKSILILELIKNIKKEF